MSEQKIDSNKIVLLAKKPGTTSFSSLFTIKHAFNTTKVGHTGTLDSFASGLLVVCAGSLTKLASRITEFDKSYEAVIKFGEETDTLECTGQVVRTAPRPSLEELKDALNKFSGIIMQIPPLFSAIHVDGKRASDLIRKGKKAEIPARPVTVFSSEILETKFDENNKILAARISFSVSKGTYIRSLARDIANECGSAAYLAGLLRTKVGKFNLQDAAGFSALEEFTIENAFKTAEKTIEMEKNALENKKNHIHEKHQISEEEILLQKECVSRSVSMNEELASLCGFGILILKNQKISAFDNGQKLHSDMFINSPFSIKENVAAVFTEDKVFKGVLEKNNQGYFGYGFVLH